MKGNLLLSLLVALGPGALAVDINTTMGLLPRQASNLQVFSGALGGIQASAITQSGDTRRPFEVDGDTFVSPGCDVSGVDVTWTDNRPKTPERFQIGGGPGMR